MKKNLFLTTFLILSFLLLAFIVVPILVLYSFSNPKDLLLIFFNGDFLDVLYVTFLAGLISTLIVAFLGVPLGYLMARESFRGKSFIQGIIDLPLVVPDTVAGLIIFLSFYSSGVFGKPFSFIGVKFVNTLPGIVVAMMFVGAPFVINTAKAGFLSIDPKLEKVAMSLGAGKFKTFISVTLPLNLESIWNGLVITWAKGVASFGSIIVIAYFPMVAPTYIYNQFLLFGISSSAVAAGGFLLITLVIFIISRFIADGLTKWAKA